MEKKEIKFKQILISPESAYRAQGLFALDLEGNVWFLIEGLETTWRRFKMPEIEQ